MCLKNRDHLLNLYGPTLVHEEGRSGMLLEPVKAIDLLDDDDEDNLSTSSGPNTGSFRRSSNRFRRSGKRSSDQELSPLNQDHQSPPPLPPRSHSFKPSTLVNNLTASFRRRNHTLSADLPGTTASSTSPENDEVRKSPNELSLIQHAFQNGSQRVRYLHHFFFEWSEANLLFFYYEKGDWKWSILILCSVIADWWILAKMKWDKEISLDTWFWFFQKLFCNFARSKILVKKKWYLFYHNFCWSMFRRFFSRKWSRSPFRFPSFFPLELSKSLRTPTFLLLKNSYFSDSFVMMSTIWAVTKKSMHIWRSATPKLDGSAAWCSQWRTMALLSKGRVVVRFFLFFNFTFDSST